MTSPRAGRSKEGRRKNRLASRIREEEGVTRRRSSVLNPAPLFISEGVVLSAPTLVVVPRPERSRSAVCRQCELPSSVALFGDIRIHLAERQRGKHRGQRETPVASQVITLPPVWSLPAHSSRAQDRRRTPAQADHPRSVVCSPWTTSTRSQRRPCRRHPHPSCREAEGKAKRSK